jgi:hexosaminidase
MGFRPAAFEATVDLGGSRELHRVGAGFLQDVGSWIWLPVELIVSVSPDGREFREVGRAGHDVPDDAGGIVLRDLTVDLDGIEARHVRVRAVPYGPIPRWHPGAGEPAWIFVDELLIE